jgi:glucokinase-like ROK family protein
MSTRNSADQGLVREINLSLVMHYLLDRAPVSRAQIAQAIGLNKSTVSSLVEDLMERRLVHETGINTVGTGRPATLLEINPQAGAIIGVALGVDYLAAAVTDFHGSILWRKSTGADPYETVEVCLVQTLALVRQAIDFCQSQSLHLLGLGLAAPGTIDLEQGVLIFAPNLGWRDVPIKTFFSGETDLTVYVENDANAAAVAEHLFGAARRSQNFIFVFAGVGIGGGLYLDGKLLRGNNGFAGEIGHAPIMMDAQQIACHCGNRGCWESYASQGAILQRMRNRMAAHPDSLVQRLMAAQNSELSIPILRQAADAGDADALETLSEAGKAMGHGFAILINVLNPEKIILGGPLSVLGDHLLPTIKATAIQHALPDSGSRVEITHACFGTDASLIGAVSIVVNDILSHPTLVERRQRNQKIQFEHPPYQTQFQSIKGEGSHV